MPSDPPRKPPVLQYVKSPVRGHYQRSQRVLERNVALVLFAQAALGAAMIVAGERRLVTFVDHKSDIALLSVAAGFIAQLWLLIRADGFWRALGPAIVLTFVGIVATGMLGAAAVSLW